VNEGETVEPLDFAFLALLGWLAVEVAADMLFSAAEWVIHG